MNKYILVGASELGKNSMKIIEEFNFGINILGYMDNDYSKVGKNLCSKNIFSIVQTEKLFLDKKIQGVIIPISMSDHYKHSIKNQLEQHGIKYWFMPPINYLNKECKKATCIEDILFDENNMEYINVVQIMTVDQCNMNCSGCSHFSCLVDKKKEYDKGQFKQDLIRLKEVIKGVGVFSFVGGEPLLHDNLTEMISDIKDVFEEATITIITNGLLLNNMTEKFWKSVKENDVFLDVTYYPAMKRMDEVHKVLDSKSVRYKIWPERTIFMNRLNPKGDSDPKTTWDFCRERSCVTMRDGKIATCYMPITIDYFNEHFGTEIDMLDSIVDLYNLKLTGKELVKKMTSYQNACRYCHEDVPRKWARCEKPSDAAIEDWM
ncbi:radical SAM protein [Paraclostridium bifermentans]|uniref:radical SAM protein n=1 Tax=Paraclostridium bifermentans TaxID=1490 RepID=UPI00374FB98D